MPVDLVNLATRVGIKAIDVGSRGEINSDLRAIAPAVSWSCLEPDADAPRDSGKNGWAAVEYITVAAAAASGNIKINLYRQRGCSSMLEADRKQAERFGRAEYYADDGSIVLEAKPLDDIITDGPASFLKIDVQGMEVECFNGAKRLLSSELLAIRTEVSFVPLYKGQPLFSEVEISLRKYGFQPMQWLERHDWRRDSRKKLPEMSKGDFPYSVGQMVHGDVVFMRLPEDFGSNSQAEVEQLVRLALISICFGLIDHARAAFSRPEVEEYCRVVCGIDPLSLLKKVSAEYARRTTFQRAIERLHKKISS